MKKMFKRIIGTALRKVGYKITKVENGFSINSNLEWFKDYKFNTILDIGANEGQFAVFANSLFQDAKIYSFEPIIKCYKVLTEINKKIPLIVPMNYALGNTNEEIEINVNQFSPSSSILKMEKKHIENFPFTAKSTKEKILIKKLDDILNEIDYNDKILVKIDVQGFEKEVILGGFDFLSNKVDLVIIETSIVKLYESEPEFEEIFSLFMKMNYKFKGVMNQLYSPVNGEILQADLIFKREH
ncbi:MAG: FkbM family methyltransferase [Ignavibacteria bacterium]|nr:FkbM family methyltransferase [Ignavibacteria bacterium]